MSGTAPFAFKICQKCTQRFGCPYDFYSKETVEGRLNNKYVFDDDGVCSVGVGNLMAVMQELTVESMSQIQLSPSGVVSSTADSCQATVGVKDAIEYFARLYRIGKLYKNQRWCNDKDNSV